MYADLQVYLTMTADNASAFGKLSDKETHALQQILYMALNNFTYVRMLLAAEQRDRERTKNGTKENNTG